MAQDPGDHSERSPLLQSDGADCEQHAQIGQDQAAQGSVSRVKRVAIVSLLIATAIMLVVGSTLVDTALLQLQEDILCEAFHPRAGLSSDLGDPVLRCKDKDVQSELSVIQSWGTVFQLLPGIVTAVPYGIVADRYGRTIVLGLSVLGTALCYSFSALVCALPTVLPLRLIWFAAAFTFIGGGFTVFSAMTFAIAADVSIESQRSMIFSYIGASFMVGGIVGNPITYWVMKRGVWPSIGIGLGILIFCTIVAFSLPETLPRVPKVDEDTGSVDADPRSAGRVRRLFEQARAGLARVTDFVRLLATEERQAGLLFLSLLLTTFGRDAQILLMQYITSRFKWSWSEAGLLLSVQFFCSLVLLTVILPGATQLLLRWLTPRSTDLLLARASILLQLSGAFVMGLAAVIVPFVAGIVLSALGYGYTFVLRGLLTSLISRDIAMLYSMISFVEAAGSIVATPLLGVSFRIGLDYGGVWIGLPYLTAGLLFTGAFAIIGGIRIAEKRPHPPEGEAQGGE